MSVCCSDCCRQEDRSRRIQSEERSCPKRHGSQQPRRDPEENAEAAERTLQKAMEDLHGTMERSSETAIDVVNGTREMS